MKKFKGFLIGGVAGLVVGVILLIVSIVTAISPIDFSSISANDLKAGNYYQFENGILLDIVATENGVYNDESTSSQAYYCAFLVKDVDEAAYIITLKVPTNSKLADEILKYMLDSSMAWGDLTANACGQLKSIDNDYYSYLESYSAQLEEYDEFSTNSIISMQVNYIGASAAGQQVVRVVLTVVSILLMVAGALAVAVSVIERVKPSLLHRFFKPETDFSYYAGPEAGFQEDSWDYFQKQKKKKRKKDQDNEDKPLL